MDREYPHTVVFFEDKPYEQRITSKEAVLLCLEGKRSEMFPVFAEDEVAEFFGGRKCYADKVLAKQSFTPRERMFLLLCLKAALKQAALKEKQHG